MKTSNDSIEESFERLYKRFFEVLGISKTSGRFIKKGLWDGLRFPTYPYIGRAYAAKKDDRVLFIGLQIGKDDGPDSIRGLAEMRRLMESAESLNPHFRGSPSNRYEILANHVLEIF
jgi:hypothetical protein